MRKVNHFPTNEGYIFQKSYRQVVNLRRIAPICLGKGKSQLPFMSDDKPFMAYPNLLIREANKIRLDMRTRTDKPICGISHSKMGTVSSCILFSNHPNLLVRDTYPSAKLRKKLGSQTI